MADILADLARTHLPPHIHRVVTSPLLWTGLILAVTAPLCFLFYANAKPRLQTVPPYKERVLILGASSGTGEQLALEYAARGCRQVVLVARRREVLEQVKAKCKDAAVKGEEWTMAQEAPGWEQHVGKERFFTVAADCTNPDDLIKIKQVVVQEMGGLDTLHICYGVSALKTLLGVVGVDPLQAPPAGKPKTVHANAAALANLQEIMNKINTSNVGATALSLATFIPVLQTTSADPVINLLSSAAAVFPAPTRAIYCSAKAAQLQLFESVALECETQAKQTKSSVKKRALVRFIAVCPGTIESNFRASAVDVAPEEIDSIRDASWDAVQSSGKKGDILTPKQVAEQMVFTVDHGNEGRIFMPLKMAAGAVVQPLLPFIAKRIAHKKYAY